MNRRFHTAACGRPETPVFSKFFIDKPRRSMYNQFVVVEAYMPRTACVPVAQPDRATAF